jgi:hypothetical protein
MHIWNAGVAAVQLRVGSLRPNVFGARLYYRDNAGVTEIPGALQANGEYLFPVTRAQAQVIKDRDAYLFLTTRHVLHAGTSDLRWGWRYKVEKGAAALKATDADGDPIKLDANNYVRSSLESFDEAVELSRETIVFV